MADWEWLYAEDVADELLTFRLAQASSSRMASCAGSRRAIRECAAQVPHFLDVWLCLCDIRNVRVTSLQFVRCLPFYLVLPWAAPLVHYCDLCHHPLRTVRNTCARLDCHVVLCALCSSHLAGVGRVCGLCKYEHLCRDHHMLAPPRDDGGVPDGQCTYEHVPGSSILMQWMVRRFNMRRLTVAWIPIMYFNLQIDACSECLRRDRRFSGFAAATARAHWRDIREERITDITERMREERKADMFHEMVRAAAAPSSSQNTAFADRRTARAKKLCFRNGPVHDIASPARTLILSYL
jgi:hypothetical protein